MSQPNIDLSIIIVNYNTADITSACIASILNKALRHTFEIVLVDNNSSDQSVEKIGQQFPTVRVIANSKNLGFAAANNIGLRASSGNYFLLLNSDTELLDNGIDHLIDLLADDDDIAVITCRLLNGDGTIQYSLRRFPSLLSTACDTFLLTPLFVRISALRRFSLLETDHQTVRDVKQIPGAFMLMRASLLTCVGMLDERYFMYYEDVDFCLRLKENNLRVVFRPEVAIIHHAGSTFRLHRVAATCQRLTSKAAYFKKNHPQVLFSIRLLITIELLWRTLLAVLLYPVLKMRYRLPFESIFACFKTATHSVWTN